MPWRHRKKSNSLLLLSASSPGYRNVVKSRVDLVTSWFGANLRHYRRARGLTQAQLAEAASLTTLYIRLLEAGSRKASFESIIKIADALNIEPCSLLVEREPMPRPCGRPSHTR